MFPTTALLLQLATAQVGAEVRFDGGLQFWCERPDATLLVDAGPAYRTRCGPQTCDSYSPAAGDAGVGARRHCTWDMATGRLRWRTTAESSQKERDEQWYANGAIRLEKVLDKTAGIFPGLAMERTWYPTGVLATEWLGVGDSKRSYRPDGCLFQVARALEGGVNFDLLPSDCQGERGDTTLMVPPLGVSRLSYVSSRGIGRGTLQGPANQTIHLTERSVCVGTRCFWYPKGPRQTEYLIAWASSGRWVLVMNTGPERYRLSTRPASYFPERIDVLFDFRREVVLSGQFEPAGEDWVKVQPGSYLHVPSGRRHRSPCGPLPITVPLSATGSDWLCLGEVVERVVGKRRERCAARVEILLTPPLQTLGPNMGLGLPHPDLALLPFYRLSEVPDDDVCKRALAGVARKAKGTEAEWDAAGP